MTGDRTVICVPGWAHGGEVFAPLLDSLGKFGISGQVISARALMGEAGLCVAAQSMISSTRVVVGWSLGAIAILSLIARVASVPPNLILLAPTPSFISREGFPWGVSRADLVALKRLFIRAPEEALVRFFSGMLQQPEQSQEVTSRVSLAMKLGREELLWGLDFLEGTDLRDALRGAEFGFETYHGVRDRLVPTPATQWFARNTGAVCRSVCAGHDILRDSPNIIIDTIRRRLH